MQSRALNRWIGKGCNPGARARAWDSAAIARGLSTLGLLCVVGCAGVPGTHPAYRVVSAETIGPLVDVRLEWTSRASAVSSDAKLSLLFPSETCAGWLTVGTEVEYESGGLTGGVRHGEQSCDAVGITDLSEWRDRKPGRTVSLPGDDRAQATYRIVIETDGYAIVRGRFPLAARISWQGGDDTLALIPRSPECSEALARDVSTIQFRNIGPVALQLVGKPGCPIAGFARVEPTLRGNP